MKQDALLAATNNDETIELVAVLFETHHREIFVYLCRFIGDEAWAHDLTQDVFLQSLRHRQRLAEVENQRAWLYQVACNHALNALKRQRRFSWLPWRKSDALGLHQPGPESVVDEHTAVTAALNQLPDDYRATLLLYAHDGFSVREIAHILEVSEGAVKTRLYRAREMFRRAYEGEIP